MNLYVSNLSYTLTDNELREAFERFGAVTHARIILDRETGRSRGFAFVEMPNDDEARAAINGLNSTELSGRPLKVVRVADWRHRYGVTIDPRTLRCGPHRLVARVTFSPATHLGTRRLRSVFTGCR